VTTETEVRTRYYKVGVYVSTAWFLGASWNERCRYRCAGTHQRSTSTQAVTGWTPCRARTTAAPEGALGRSLGADPPSAASPYKLIVDQPGEPARRVANSEVTRASYDLLESPMERHETATPITLRRSVAVSGGATFVD